MGNQIPAAAILPWRTARHPLEGGAEGAFGFVAERAGDDGNGIAGVHEPVPGQPHLPARQVVHRGRPDRRLFRLMRRVHAGSGVENLVASQQNP